MDRVQNSHWVLVVVLILANPTHATEKCLPGMDTPGITSPGGDIVLEAGNPLKINCTIFSNHSSAEGKNASDLMFYEGNNRVPEEFITIVNSTTIQLTVTDLPMNTYIYYCRLGDQITSNNQTPVCLNKVIVGKKPEEVQNFNCVSYNWQRLVCRWSVQPNPVATKYKIYFNLFGRAGRMFNATCPEDTDIRYNNCTWDERTDPLYRIAHAYYYFTITGINQLGTVTFPVIKFHHYAHVIPSPPVNLLAHNESSYSVDLTWGLPLPLTQFPSGLLHRVQYRSHWDPAGHWEIANTSSLDRHSKNLTFHLSGLKYAYTIYNIRVSMKSSVAVGDRWSIPANISIRTTATIPGTSPKTDIGSFEVVSGMNGRDVYIYWTQIPKYLQNGDNFEYRVTQVEENGEIKTLTPNETTLSYARIRNLSHNSYKFIIHARNSIGDSENPSIITIPSSNAKLPEPLSFTNIVFENGVYELSWKKPSDYMTIENYTIFWCDNERDRPYQCTGFLNWTHVPNDINIKNITVPDDKIYQFAISANTANSSSGMIWATCTVIHNKGIGKMKNLWINKVGSTFIEIGWKLECSDRIGLVKGYRIFYCPIISPMNSTCRDPLKNTTVEGDALNIHGNITDLMPYMTYWVAVSVMSRGGEGLQSDPKFATTLEAAPEPPLDLFINEISNTSMVVSWSPPRLMNGVLQYYNIHYNNKTKRVEGRTQEKLQNLRSYMNYTVYVTACTKSCSEPSEKQTIQTTIGNPGVVNGLSVNRSNVSQISVEWNMPSLLERGGMLDHYELKVEEAGNGQNFTKVHVIKDIKFTIPVRECDDQPRTYKIWVRAVNVDYTSKPMMFYYGQWSGPAGIDSCYDTGFTQIKVIVWTLCVVLCALVVLAIWFYGKKCWFCCKEMQNVEVKLPPGLDPPRDKDMLHLSNCGGLPRPGDANSKKQSGDLRDSEVRGLLPKNNERHGRNPSGDSSGCSSGHDSVSSSLTSNTQISSDSGAEVDQLNGLSGMSDGVYDHADLHKSTEDSTRWDLFSKQSQYSGSSCGAHSTPNLSASLSADTDSHAEVRSDTTRYTYVPGNYQSTGNLPARAIDQSVSSSASTLYCKVGSPEATPTHSTSYCKLGTSSTTPMVPAAAPTAAAAAVEADTTLRSQVPSSLPSKRGYVTLAQVPATVAASSSGYVAHPSVWSQPASIESSLPANPVVLPSPPTPQNRTLAFTEDKPHLECIPEIGDSYSRLGCRASWQAPPSNSASALSLTDAVEGTSSYVKLGDTPNIVTPNTPMPPVTSVSSPGYVAWPCDPGRRPAASTLPTPTVPASSAYVQHSQVQAKCLQAAAAAPKLQSQQQQPDSYTRVCNVPNSPELDNSSNTGGSTGSSVAAAATPM